MQVLAKELLVSKLKEIHQGYYPKQELKALAQKGLFNGFNEGLFGAVKNIMLISSYCANTGFCVWCQYTLIWYLQNSSNETLKNKFIPLLSSGTEFGGTGLSNGAKALSDIEKNFIKAKKVDKGYVLNGSLPWVSNLDNNHYFALLCDADENEKIFAFIDCSKAKLSDKIHFCALEGSATKSVSLNDYFLSDEFIIAKNGEEFFKKVLKGFLLLQCGMGLGLCKNSIELMKKAKKDDINFLPIKPNMLLDKVYDFEKKTALLCENVNNTDIKEIVEFRLVLAELSLECSKWAVLYQGSNAYLKDSNGVKNLLESYFMALVTPSIKHLYKLLAK
ncbi:acyl-CoA dehydrogenase [Campylobacter sp. LR185c]|uniref:acyl-CoA dehydrogenase family protein n=1 Tax=Campylobacter sp. LR185c TaxID=2014525 RepID=UPI001237E435|nr:acyl-CoA dehydrogenase family protein [Campylobacter sp. LR185c]KAA6225631.1 acyl-CoA dehydrogenase [Campylobacter sp. LR185c]KAA8603853.1 hypothetical protein CGP82_05520 [Campylobacter sp. LR185c]